LVVMPKKGKAKAAPTPAVAAAPAAAVAPSKAQEEEERALLEKQWKEKADANTRKAELSQASQLRQNARNQQWEKDQQKQHLQTVREEKKWTKELEKIKTRAKRESIFESEDWGDGKWWIQIGDLYKEVKGEYFCVLCEKHLCSGTLEAHMESEVHRKRLAWTEPQAGSVAGAPSATARSATAPSAVCPPAAARTSAGLWPPFKKEDWMEESNGFLRCIPCGKVIDENHLAKEDHQNRLARWQDAQRAQLYGRAAPTLPYLAYVPWDDSDPTSERNLKCLLCGKWVQDEVSHSGTRQAPAGAKDHQKYLRNYGPGDPWYEANVVKVRQKWHPDARPTPPTVSLRHAEVVEA